MRFVSIATMEIEVGALGQEQWKRKRVRKQNFSCEQTLEQKGSYEKTFQHLGSPCSRFVLSKMGLLAKVLLVPAHFAMQHYRVLGAFVLVRAMIFGDAESLVRNV